MAKRYQETVDGIKNRMTLYLYIRPDCVFCIKVLDYLKKNNFSSKVRIIDIYSDLEALAELRKSTQQQVTPYLKTVDKSGKITWIPESEDIIKFIHKKFT